MPAHADVVSVVEAAYRLDVSGVDWLGAVTRAAGSQLFDELGGIACFFDSHAPESTSIVSGVTSFGADERLVAAIRAAFEMGTSEERDRSLRQGGPILRLSRVAETKLVDNPYYGPLARSIGFADVIVLRAVNPDGTGAFFAAPLRPGTRRGAEWTKRWSLASAHLSAGLRLQRAAHAAIDDASAILTPNGRVLSLAKGAETARDVLRRAAIEMDHARSKRGRRDELHALEGWHALVDGRWSLVDHFESDGKRHVIALENAPLAPDPRALAPEERPILHYVAMGHANKMIAYELGLPLGTVATRVRTIMRKLGVRSRVEIVDRYSALTQMEFARVESAGATIYAGAASRFRTNDEQAKLTPAEDEVARLAGRGLSTKEIARHRACAPRTVANLLASAFKKLGVQSRAELRARPTART